MTNFQELNQEIQKAQAQYEEKAKDLDQAQRLKEDAEIALIRADSTYKRLRLEVAVIKSRADSLKEQSYNLRREAGIR